MVSGILGQFTLIRDLCIESITNIREYERLVLLVYMKEKFIFFATHFLVFLSKKKNEKIAMRRLLFLSFIILILGSIQAQSNLLFVDISEGFIQNDNLKLADRFAQTIDLTIEETNGTYSKQQASILIKDFLQKNKSTSFEIKHQGSSNNKTFYAVCLLKSLAKKWNVYVLLNKNKKIIQLQIEE